MWNRVLIFTKRTVTVFIPPVVGVIQYQNLLIASGCKILLVILISTLLVMMTSVYTVKLFLNHDSLKQEKEYD